MVNMHAEAYIKFKQDIGEFLFDVKAVFEKHGLAIVSGDEFLMVRELDAEAIDELMNPVDYRSIF